MRITIKQLEERIKTINELTNNKYELKLFITTGCGVDISINGEYQADNLNRLFTNKEVMDLLDKKFNKEIKQIIMGL